MTSIQWNADSFKATILQNPRFIDEEKCTACGRCVDYCPVKILDKYNENLTAIKAIYQPYPQAIPAAYVIDQEYCRFIIRKDCTACRPVCEAKAIDLYQKKQELQLHVGAIIVATGFKMYNPELKGEYGYSRFKNVITSIELERILSSSGPTNGIIKRPSDKRSPIKIAWIQCVGSRDKADKRNYCSSICCKSAIKQAYICSNQNEDIKSTIFYNDLRIFGKNISSFLNKAKNHSRINFVSSSISSIKEVPGSKNLLLKYINNNNTVIEEEFELVILSIGMVPSDEVNDIYKKISIDIDQSGFCKASAFHPLETSKEGIFAAGTFLGPKDISESIITASGAAYLAAKTLYKNKYIHVKEKQLPEEKDISGENRIGIFICHCGKNISEIIKIKELLNNAEKLNGVKYVSDLKFACARDSQDIIKKSIVMNNLNKVVIAACTPRTHEIIFQESIREAGLNRNLLEMINIREQCAWVHPKDIEEANEKATDLLKMAIFKSRYLVSLKEKYINVIPSCLVIGGGISGMTAALAIANLGYKCYLIEKEDKLGGNFCNVYFTLDNDNPQQILEKIIDEVVTNPLIEVYKNTEIDNVAGYIGNFKTSIIREKSKYQLLHGIIIIAVGAKQNRPIEYLYGKHKNIFTQTEIEQRLFNGLISDLDTNTVVMIQCVGSKTDTPYCSKICCSQAIKNALKIKELYPSSDIYILYMNMMTYGLLEKYYLEAREKGIIFIQYKNEKNPIVDIIAGQLNVTFDDSTIHREIILKASMLVLSTGIIPNDNSKISQLLNIPNNSEGFFLEAHEKMKPVDFSINGIFLCGLAHSPMPLNESIVQAQAAAMRGAIILAKDTIEIEPTTSSIDVSRCLRCGICVEICPFDAVQVVYKEDMRTVEIMSPLCRGCGICVTRCPNHAITIGKYTNDQINAQITALSLSAN